MQARLPRNRRAKQHDDKAKEQEHAETTAQGRRRCRFWSGTPDFLVLS
jgi:hypothetical protein